jgi:hypothetical protein
MRAPVGRLLAILSAILVVACADYGHLRAPSASPGSDGGDGPPDHSRAEIPLADGGPADALPPSTDAGAGLDVPSADTTAPPDAPPTQPDVAPGGLDTAPTPEDLAFGCPPDPGLRLCFTFDDVGVGTRLTDRSGRGNHGFLDTAKVAGGVLGSALSFSAGTHVARLPDSDSLRLAEGEVTFEAWIRPAASPLDGGADVIIGKVDLDYVGWALALYGSDVRLYVNGTTWRGAPGVRFGFWNHVAVVLGTAGALVYVDGKQVLEMMTPLPIPLNTVPVSIGNTNPAIPNDKARSAFTGEVDVVRIYGRTRRPDEICAAADGRWMAGGCRPRTATPEP